MLGLTIRFRHVRCTDYPQVFASTVPLPVSSHTVVEGKANEKDTLDLGQFTVNLQQTKKSLYSVHKKLVFHLIHYRVRNKWHKKQSYNWYILIFL